MHILGSWVASGKVDLYILELIQRCQCILLLVLVFTTVCSGVVVERKDLTIIVQMECDLFLKLGGYQQTLTMQIHVSIGCYIKAGRQLSEMM